MVELPEPEVTEQVEKENATPPASAGLLLRQAREAAGVHVLALAETLKVPAAKLQALEAEDWQALPDKVFTRSLALGVCKTLHIDAAPILALLPKADSTQRFTAPGPGINEPFRDKAVRSVHDTPASGNVWRWGGLAVLGAVAAGAWYFASQQDVRDAVVASVNERSQRAMGSASGSEVGYATQPATPALTSAPSAAPSVSPADTAPASSTTLASANSSRTGGNAPASAVAQTAPATDAVEAAKPVAAPLPAPVTVVANEPVAAPATTMQPAVVPTPAAQPAAEAVATATPVVVATNVLAAANSAASAGTPSVRIQVNAPTWIQVRSQGRVVEQKTLNAGETFESHATKPLSVVVGRADAATVQVNGADFDLGAVTRVNVARFEVK